MIRPIKICNTYWKAHGFAKVRQGGCWESVFSKKDPPFFPILFKIESLPGDRSQMRAQALRVSTVSCRAASDSFLAPVELLIA